MCGCMCVGSHVSVLLSFCLSVCVSPSAPLSLSTRRYSILLYWSFYSLCLALHRVTAKYPDVKTVAVHPGWSATALLDNASGWVGRFFAFLNVSLRKRCTMCVCVCFCLAMVFGDVKVVGVGNLLVVIWRGSYYHYCCCLLLVVVVVII